MLERLVGCAVEWKIQERLVGCAVEWKILEMRANCSIIIILYIYNEQVK